jgi:hypothetical protein
MLHIPTVQAIELCVEWQQLFRYGFALLKNSTFHRKRQPKNPNYAKLQFAFQSMKRKTLHALNQAFSDKVNQRQKLFARI